MIPSDRGKSGLRGSKAFVYFDILLPLGVQGSESIGSGKLNNSGGIGDSGGSSSSVLDSKNHG